MCTKQVHELLIQNDNAVNCIFCSKQIQDPGRPKRYFCCHSMSEIHLFCNFYFSKGGASNSSNVYSGGGGTCTTVFAFAKEEIFLVFRKILARTTIRL